MTLRARLYIGFWVVILAAFGVLLSNQLVVMEALALEEAQAQAAVEAELRTMRELQLTYETHMSYIFVEQVARERLGFIRADEVIFINDAD